MTKKDIPVGFIEAKDIGDKDLEGAKKTGNKEQFDRYKSSLSNLIFTDYINFLLYRDGQFVTKITIAEVTTTPNPSKGGEIKAIPENFTSFENLIKDFCTHIGQTIKSSRKLAEMMAGKARLLSEVIEKALTSDEEQQEDSTLKDQMMAFQQILIHDITPRGFADVYAQTIAYGLFAARYHDPTLPTFSRQEAYELIPKSNPFLKKLFGYIAGLDVDDRIKWIVDDLVTIFLACNVEEMLRNYGKTTKTEDPIIHFYEDFLSEYDPKLRKARGVWYTPAPVVNFIVRAVDDILKTEFGLPQGLADTSKTAIKIDAQGKKIEQEVHRVQILDPATGTGTFLAEVVKLIHQKFAGQQGIWSNYVETHLLPRLNGFELLMASYAMAHLKLDLLLTETGYKPTKDQRFRVYLTNSLEEHHPDSGTLWANWLSSEANEANRIKRDTPVMVVMGNPPYSGISSNNGEWISKLIEDYKYVDGVHFNERKHWLNDDYVKFIRYGQHFIEKNGSGVLAFINPHGFLDNPTFRGMRWHLLNTYDKIFTIDLHGNSKKKETAPDGSADVNVFDIMQGVSINIFIKTGKKKPKELGKVFHFDLYGKREMKYDFLSDNSLTSVSFQELKPEKPFLFFVPKNTKGQKEYENGFRVDELFSKNVTGIVSMGDSFIINENRKVLKTRLESLINNEMSEDYLNREFGLGKNYAEWILNNRTSIKIEDTRFTKISYRIFDDRYTYFDNKALWRWRVDVMQHFLKGRNVGIDLCRQTVSDTYTHIFVTDKIVDDSFVSNKSKERGYVFPLYLYPEPTAQQTIEPAAQLPLTGFETLSEVKNTARTPNLNMEIVKQIAEKLGLAFVPEKETPPVGHPSNGGEHSPLSEGWSKTGVVKDIVTHINSIPIKRNFVENLPHNPALNQLAKDKRKAGILSEVLFWQQVHQGKFHHIDFDRQRIIGNYIVDFYVKTLGLVIEIDGSSHDDKIEYDAQRQEYLERLGLRVYRIADGDVKKNLGIVMQELESYIIREYGTTPPVGHPSNGGELTTPAFSHPSTGGEFAPIDLLDYIYAVLHSPTYREKYKEFLKIDFPRVPYPKDRETFCNLVELGSELRQIHLMESPILDEYITQYPVDGDNVVTKVAFQLYDYDTALPEENGNTEYPDYLGAVYINENQYFADVPLRAWEFYIGGYQPAQKWLKDRKSRKLEFEDILHYQKIIVALSETDRLMKEIDKIEIE